MEKLSLSSYRGTIEGVSTQFDLIRFALKNLPQTRLKSFFKQRSEEEMTLWKGTWKSIKESGAEISEDVEAMFFSSIQSDLRKKYSPRIQKVSFEVTEDRLNQSELLLLVAHFESFLKLIHRKFLDVAPGKVFGNRKTPITVQDVFDPKHSHLSTNKFLRELIEKEIKELDRQNIQTKADYFQKHFGIAFGNQKQIEDLKEIMELRNVITHQIYSPPAKSLDDVSDQDLVPAVTLKNARGHFLRIPSTCIEAGAKTYQSYFKYP